MPMPFTAAFLPSRSWENKSQTQRTLWIFGAGASVHLRFPISKGFIRSTQEVAAENEHLKSAITDLPKKLHLIGINITEDAILDTPPEDILRLIRSVPKVVEPESYRSAKHRRGLIKLHKNDIASAEDCLNRIYFAGLSVFNERARSLSDEHWTNSCYNQLVRNFFLGDNTRVISFNYDTMLDEAIFRQYPGRWQYEGIQVVAINGNPIKQRKKRRNDLLLIKPHGSLNLMECKNCRSVHLNWLMKYAVRGEWQLAINNRRCTICTKPVSKRKDLTTDLQLSPLYGKQAIHDCRKSIIDAFSWATNIISVGFSFPDQDEYLFRCINAGIKNNKSSKIVISLVSQSKSGTEKLRTHLLNKLSTLTIRKLIINATDINGFESI